ncbi:ABC transporter ATP-binding protein/permease [Devosia sp. XJ19-1]|uniref:ABC transporter ATP-binding protein/permease n=1 Tax=Devosia ureilytica TaxID=2952754 RepID=A0A9Q4ASH6_9HYPH|nr:ABC transporter ATP-binding protein [Devosia ureilytica]MCP8885089.1 ABC transporter ATP-binding protein/permease [Devosia ureilytica]MCP8888812.1 ABC transporter ATP-binding protein/permease [Devosia ureilytica]
MSRKKRLFPADAFRNVLGFTFAHWRRQPVRIVMICGLVIASTLAEVMVPLFSGRIVDAIAGNDNSATSDALRAFAVVVGLGLTSVVLRFFIFHRIIKLTLKMMADIVNDGFHRVQRFSTDWHANSFAGSTVRKVTRGMWALDALNDILLVALLPSVVMLAGASILLGSFWPVMGLIVAIGSLIYIGVTIAMSMGYVAPAASLANAWDTRLGGALADAVSCNSVVKAFGAEAREEGRMRHVLSKWDSRTRRTWKRGTLNGTIQGFMMVSMQAGILGTGLFMWTRGLASPGDITFVLAMFFVLQGYLRDVGMHIRNLQRSVNDMEELVALTSMPLGIDDRPGATPIAIGAGGIRFENVTFQYGAHPTPLYRDFSVEIKPGERVGLVGHSGSGKTTFVKLIQRLYDVKDGAITIDGQNIAEHQQASLRNQIAIVQQEPILFHRTLAENIAYGRPDASRAQIMEAAEQANAHEFIMSLPKQYETMVGERGVKLSGGERQRVAIARAFLADAPILILDEATSSLDSESEVMIQQAMERLMQGRTTLVIAHRLSTVRALDRLLVFDKGRIVEEGDHAALIRLSGGIYRRLFERQALELTKGLVA